MHLTETISELLAIFENVRRDEVQGGLEKPQYILNGRREGARNI